MPAISKAMYRAMQAAAHGKSTLGIPAKVGKEFVAATPSPKALPERAPDPSPAHEAQETPAMERQEHATGQEAMDEHSYCTERCEHHRKMARKAGSPAARALHKKLQAHYANKLKKR